MDRGDENLVTFDNGSRINIVEAVLLWMRQSKRDSAALETRIGSELRDLADELRSLRKMMHRHLSNIETHTEVTKIYTKNQLDMMKGDRKRERDEWPPTPVNLPPTPKKPKKRRTKRPIVDQ